MEEDQEAKAQHQREDGGSVRGGGEGLEANGGGVNDKEIPSFTCHICNKGFVSGKALGGHMRIHNLPRKQVRAEKQGTTDGAKSKTSKWVVVDGNPTCSLCGKTFSSMKSLYGHMRSHTEKSKRGIQSDTPIVGASSTSSSGLSDDKAVDLSGALRGWSVTAKRGRRSPSCSKSNSGLEDDNDDEPRMQEAAYELILLARGSPKREREEEVAADPIQEQLEELLHPAIQNFSDVKIKMTCRKKLKLTESASTEERNRFSICRKCHTTFKRQQSQKGHLCGLQIQSEAAGVSGKKEEHHAKTTIQGEKTGTGTGTVVEGSGVEAVRGNECEVLNRTFSTVEASGDHKRSDGTSMAEAQSAEGTSSNVETGQSRSKGFRFDLNQIPAMDEEEGVEDMMTSSNYTIPVPKNTSVTDH